jgi:hypothetical protein
MIPHRWHPFMFLSPWHVEASWNLTGQAENMRLVAEMVFAIANREEMPRWLTGDEFAGVRTKDK